jgi:hypothetical protein
MTNAEPEKVKAIRTAVALELRLDPSEVELEERVGPRELRRRAVLRHAAPTA